MQNPEQEPGTQPEAGMEQQEGAQAEKHESMSDVMKSLDEGFGSSTMLEKVDRQGLTQYVKQHFSEWYNLESSVKPTDPQKKGRCAQLAYDFGLGAQVLANVFGVYSQAKQSFVEYRPNDPERQALITEGAIALMLQRGRHLGWISVAITDAVGNWQEMGMGEDEAREVVSNHLSGLLYQARERSKAGQVAGIDQWGLDRHLRNAGYEWDDEKHKYYPITKKAK